MSQTPPTNGSAPNSASSSSADSRCEERCPAEATTADRPHVDNRRKFIRGSSLLIAGALPAAGLAIANSALSAAATTIAPRQLTPGLAADSPRPREIKLGLIGCGFRGLNVISGLLSSRHGAVRCQLTAMADAFPDRMQQALRGLKGKFPQQLAVDSAARCVGLSGFQRLLEQDIDCVVLATPPAFRPDHFEAAVKAGKHVYAEKPIAVDADGARRFQAANLRALAGGLVVSVGWPRHHQPQFYATLDQLRSGAIGRIVTAQAFQNVRPPNLVMSHKSHAERDMQLRNWTRHNWTSGGPWIEPQVHNLDTMNCLIGAHPVAARTAAPDLLSGIAEWKDFSSYCGPSASREHHLPVEFLYAEGISLVSYCQFVEAPRMAKRVLTVHGTDGHCDLIAGKIFDSAGRLTWRAPQISTDCGQFDALIKALSDGSPFNQAAAAVEATFTAILGRTANQRQQLVEWSEVA